MSGTRNPDDWRNVYTELGSNVKENSVHDVCFSVGRERKIFWAHKHILASRCPAFVTMFFQNYTEKFFPIPIPDDDPEAFEILIRFLYKKDLYCHSVLTACKTHSLGVKYRLPSLEAIAKKYIYSVPMNDQILLNIVESGLFFHPAVKDRCLEYICENTDKLVTSFSFLKMPENIVELIVHMEDINVREFPLLMAVTRWCYNRYDGQVNFKEKLFKFLGQIRYSDMMISEFYAFIKHFPGAMDSESSYAIVKYISKSTNTLPSWCTSKGQRRLMKMLMS